MPPALTGTLAVLLAGLSALGPGAPPGGAPPAPRRVSTARLLEAMREVRRYDLTATTNGPRLQADVLLALLREAAASDPERRPLLVGHREWFEAFLARTGLAPASAPLYVRRPFEVGQDLLVDHRPGVVVDAVRLGPSPRLAANVRIYWAKAPGKPDQYSYDDTLSRPTLRVIQKRLITYRLVDYPDRLWYAEVSGLHGRPTSGPLGLLFDVIGEARVEDTRSAVAADGVQVVRGRASKWGIDRTETMTIWPDGRADRGVPADRADLRALEARLAEPLDVRFHPLADAPD